MNTPTPGDLSARLQPLSDACLSRRLTPAECGEFHDCIAALSALPAAGGEESSRTLFGCAYQLAGYHDAPEAWLDRLSDAMQGRPLPDSDTLIAQLLPYAPDTPEKWDGHTHVASEDDGDTCEVCGRNFRAHATTPQPSAAEPKCGCGRPGEYESKDGPACNKYFRCKDAAVGAQGDGDAEFWAERLDMLAEVHGCGSATMKTCANLIRRLAAPAAGKGVDALPAKWREDADKMHSAAMRAQRRDDMEAMYSNLDAAKDARGYADELEAALTRQPVAGDGMVLVPKELTREMFSAGFRQQYGVSEPDPPGGYFDIFNDWYKAMIAAAPAATPTDGGEGS